MNILLAESTTNLIMSGVWAAVFVFALILEISTAALVSVWFCVGALAALCFTFIPGVPVYVEIIVFFVVSIALLIGLIPLKRKIEKKNNLQTNVDKFVEQSTYLLKGVNDKECGLVKVDGVTWEVITLDGKEIAEGTKVKMVGILGNKIIVEKLED